MGLKATIVASPEWDAVLYQWLLTRFPEGWHLNENNCRFIGLVNLSDERPVELNDIVCVTAINRWTPSSCEVTVATNPKAVVKTSREYIVFVLDYIFNVWGKTHITSHVDVENTPSIVGTRRLGFKQECRLEDYRGEGKDAYLFSLTKRQWLHGRWSSTK